MAQATAAVAAFVAGALAARLPALLRQRRRGRRGIPSHADAYTDCGKEWRLLAHVKKTAPAGDVSAAIAAADNFSWAGNWVMAVGDVKGKIVADALAALAPPAAKVLEVGCYCGYGAMTLARAAPGARVYTIEKAPRFAGVAREMVAHAGLDARVAVLDGDVPSLLPGLAGLAPPGPFAFVFLDHAKQWYVRDLVLLLDAGLLSPGGVVVGDNLLTPGAPEFWAWMKASPFFETTFHETALEYSESVKDVVSVSVYKGGWVPGGGEGAPAPLPPTE